MAKGKYKNKKRKEHKDEIAMVFTEAVRQQHPEKEEEYKRLSEKYKKMIANDPHRFDKVFDDNPVYYFYLKLLLAINIESLKQLRRYHNISAEELDDRLGYTKNYPRKALVNTYNNPTPRNTKIAMKVCHTISMFSRGKKLDVIKTNSEQFDLEEMINESFELAGLSLPIMTESEAINEDENIEEIKVVKEEIEAISNDNDLEFLKQKALSVSNARTIEEVVDTANQILKLAEILKGA